MITDTRTCTVSTGLRSHVRSEFKPFLIPALEEVVQARSQIETLACLVYSDALLDRLHTHPRVPLPEIYLNQMCFNAAIRAVCRPAKPLELKARQAAFKAKSVEKYLASTHKYKAEGSPGLNEAGQVELHRCKTTHETRNKAKGGAYEQARVDLQAAQARFQSQLPDDVTCPPDTGLGQTMNAASLRYVTNFSNSVFMTIAQRQTKTIKLQLTAALRTACGSSVLPPGVVWALVNWLQRKINGQDVRMTQNMALARCAMIRGQHALGKRMCTIVREHRLHMPIVIVDERVEQVNVRKYGYTAEHEVKKIPWSFVHYNMYLARTVAAQRCMLVTLNEAITKDELKNGNVPKPSSLHRLPRLFQVIPQLVPKLRFMTFGSEQLGELLTRMAQPDAPHAAAVKKMLELPVHGKVKKTSILSRIKNGYDADKDDPDKPTNPVWHRLFRKLPKGFAGTMTTDCIRATWMVEKKTQKVQPQKKTKRKKSTDTSNSGKTNKRQKMDQEGNAVPRDLDENEEKEERKNAGGCHALTALSRGHLGYHIADVTFNVKEGDALHVIAVDPGHVNLMCAVRKQVIGGDVGLDLDIAPPVCIQPEDAIPVCQRQRLRAAKNRKHKSLGLSEYTLTNKHWQHQCGRDKQRKRTQAHQLKLQMFRVQEELSQCVRQSPDPQVYRMYQGVRLRTLPKFINMMNTRLPRRWALEVYRQEQRAVQKLSTDLRGDIPKDEAVVLVWGGGGFGPTSRGHASAPNKKLQDKLARSFALVISSEYRTSKVSCCCWGDVRRTTCTRKRASVLLCETQGCKQMLSRDFSAAVNILSIFEFQRENDTMERPDPFKHQGFS
jgi:hypothetical protein